MLAAMSTRDCVSLTVLVGLAAVALPAALYALQFGQEAASVCLAASGMGAIKTVSIVCGGGA